MGKKEKRTPAVIIKWVGEDIATGVQKKKKKKKR